MRVSLKWLKRYIDLPEDLTAEKIATDLTVRTVEVEKVIDCKKLYDKIIVGKILEVKPHINADKLKVCMVDIGEEKPVQIVCGGINLYAGEMVVISLPGSVVVWHGEGQPVKITETKMRGVSSYGMICNPDEVYLSDFFPVNSEEEIIDLKIDCYPGQKVSDLIEMDDVIFEIDNKSLTNRPDLWGHLGIARELSAIYNVPLKEVKEEIELDTSNLKEYKLEIQNKDLCKRCVLVEMDGVYDKQSPMWMKQALIAAGMRPINAVVDITNYVMLSTGQPCHAYDKTHVEGEKIIVRNAKEGEKLLLLDDNYIDLTTDDLVISDEKEVLGLAGIKGGKKDSVLPETRGIVLEMANFDKGTIRKTGKRFDEKTDASIRYEKGIDTERISLGINLSIKLFKELFPEIEIVAYNDLYLNKTKRAEIEVEEKFLDERLGTKIEKEKIEEILTNLGYDFEYKNNTYKVLAPVFRSTGDVSIKDDVLGDIARLYGYDNFEEKPLPVNFTHAVNQINVNLERSIKEYLAKRCNFYEIFTYPWVHEKYLNETEENTDDLLELEAPPSPEYRYLRNSLIPGMLDSIIKNLRYYDNFKLFEVAEVFSKNDEESDGEKEVLPIQKKYLTGAVVGKDPKDIFIDVKGVLENISSYTHMEEFRFREEEKEKWADPKGFLNIYVRNEKVGKLGLVSLKTMTDLGIKKINIALFELQMDKFIPYPSRTNKYKKLPEYPLVQKDLSVIVDEKISWDKIVKTIKSSVKEIEFVDEYKGSPIEKGKKSVTFRYKIGGDKTLTSEEIANVTKEIMDKLNKKCKAFIREE